MIEPVQKELITRSEILMGREIEYPLTPELEENLRILLMRLNVFRRKYGRAMNVSSGYRPGKYNKPPHANGSEKSSHIKCQAADFSDPDRSLTNWILSNPSVLVDCDLYMEHPKDTPTWVHLQSRMTGSGRRIFGK